MSDLSTGAIVGIVLGVVVVVFAIAFFFWAQNHRFATNNAAYIPDEFVVVGSAEALDADKALQAVDAEKALKYRNKGKTEVDEEHSQHRTK